MFGKHLLKIDPAVEAQRISDALRHSVRQTLRRYGGVVGVSGGVDSSVVLALCEKAFGSGHIAAIIMPEIDLGS